MPEYLGQIVEILASSTPLRFIGCAESRFRLQQRPLVERFMVAAPVSVSLPPPCAWQS